MDYQGNSRKEKSNPERPAKNIEKVITGEVVQKPKNLGRRFKDVFFGGDTKQAAKFVASDVLLPAMRNLIVDMVTKGAERMIYGESNYRRRGPGVNYGAHYQLNPSAQRNPFDPRTAAPTVSGVPRGRQNRHEINDVVLSSREEADLVVERLSDILEKYDVVSLADLYDLLGLQTSHIDNKWGWTYINNVPVRQIRQGYLLELPPLEEI